MTSTLRSAFAALAALPFALSAQTIHVVEVGGSSISEPAPYYLPAEITIPVGDIIRWINDSGTHNVNGTFFTFPDNPEEFYSGEPDNSTWSYSYQFNTPGVYNYHCDTEGHAATQMGMVTVLGPNSVAPIEGATSLPAYPNPVEAHLNIELGNLQVIGATILTMDGRVLTATYTTSSGNMRIDTGSLSPGNYVINLLTTAGPQQVRFTK